MKKDERKEKMKAKKQVEIDVGVQNSNLAALKLIICQSFVKMNEKLETLNGKVETLNGIVETLTADNLLLKDKSNNMMRVLYDTNDTVKGLKCKYTVVYRDKDSQSSPNILVDPSDGLSYDSDPLYPALCI